MSSSVLSALETLQLNFDSGANKATTVRQSYQEDTLGKLRVVNPTTVFDNKFLTGKNPQFFQESDVSGSGGAFEYKGDFSAVRIYNDAVGTAVKKVFQTYQRFPYESGKSQLIYMTGRLSVIADSLVDRSMGIFDDENGFFFNDNGVNCGVVRRTSSSGSAVDNRTPQSSFNIDTVDGNGSSGQIWDPAKFNVYVIDFTWLGGIKVRYGIVLGGKIVYVHQENYSNTANEPFLSHPNLPLRYELNAQAGAGANRYIEAVCQSVISEGGYNLDRGITRSIYNTANVTGLTSGSVYGIIGLRFKTTFGGSTYRRSMLQIVSDALKLVSTSDECVYGILHDPSISGIPVWNDVDANNSVAQYAFGSNLITLSGGIRLSSHFLETDSGGGASSESTENREVSSTINLGYTISGASQTVWLYVEPLTASVDVRGIVNWIEIT